jgi:hypothetical protein
MSPRSCETASLHTLGDGEAPREHVNPSSAIRSCAFCLSASAWRAIRISPSRSRCGTRRSSASMSSRSRRNNASRSTTVSFLSLIMVTSSPAAGAKSRQTSSNLSMVKDWHYGAAWAGSRIPPLTCLRRAPPSFSHRQTSIPPRSKRERGRSSAAGHARSSAVVVVPAGDLSTSAGVARATATSRRSHGPATTPDPLRASSPRAMSQTKARDLCVYGIHFTIRKFMYGPSTITRARAGR